MTHSLLHRRLIVVTGKGGVGKTTIAGAIGLLSARQGRKTLVVELGDASGLQGLFGHPPPANGVPQRLAQALFSTSIDQEQALAEWMQSLGGRLPAKLLASKASFQYFAAAAPGAKELVAILKVSSLASDGEGYDLVVLDAPATGHALAMLSSPQTFASIAKRGPIARQAEQVRAMLADRSRTGYLAVAHASEMAVAETLELQAELRSQLDVELAAVVVNATLHRRFTREELDRIRALRAESSLATHRAIAASAAAAAEAAHARTRFQHSQVTRLRKHGLDVLQLPLVFQSEIDLAALEKIADKLDGKI